MGGRVVSLSPTACLSKRSMATTRTHRQGRAVGAALLLTALSSLAGMVPVGRSTPAGGVTAAAAATPPHIMVIVEENQEYGSIIGSSNAPYINSLARTYRSATNWYAVQHNSPTDYLDLLSGSDQGLPNGKPYSVPTLVDELHAGSIPWRGYMESMPSNCFKGTTADGLYDPIHNPFHYFTNYFEPIGRLVQQRQPQHRGGAALPRLERSRLRARRRQCARLRVDHAQRLRQHARSHQHGFPVREQLNSQLIKAGDSWLSSNLAPVLTSTWFKQNGIVIITWDEGTTAAGCCGLSAPGGHIATLVVAAGNQGQGQFTGTGDLFGILRGIETTYGVNYLGASADPANGDISAAFGQVPTTGSITGTVTDGNTNAPLAGASVSYSGGSATTDADGKYSCQSSRRAPYAVTAAATGYTSVNHNVTVTAGLRSQQDFWVRPPAPPPFHPTGVGQPAVTVGGDGTQLLFWSGAGGHLIEAWWNGSWNGPVDWTAANGWAATVTSAPSVVIQANGTQLIFWQGPGGHLFEAWYAGGWNGPVDWTAANHWPASVTSAPSVALAPDGTQLIFWQGAGGHLMEAWWNGPWNGPVDWTAANRWAASVASSPSVTFSGTTQLIFWKGTTGHLVEAWWNGSWNGPVDWTAANSWGSPLTSAPTAVVQSGGTQLIFWQGAGGHLDEVWWNGHWNGPVDWTAANRWGSPLTSAPSAALQSGGTQLIFWQGTGGHLIEAWWNGSWNGPVDWSAG